MMPYVLVQFSKQCGVYVMPRSVLSMGPFLRRGELLHFAEGEFLTRYGAACHLYAHGWRGPVHTYRVELFQQSPYALHLVRL